MGCSEPEITEIVYSEIDTSEDPVQFKLGGESDKITKIIKNGKIDIEPAATYKVAGKVANKRRYYDWVGEYAPIFDIVLIWGKLADPDNDKFFSYDQFGFTYKSEGPLDNSYVNNHLGRYYVYPATENIQKAISIIEEKETVLLEGFLINTKLTYQGEVSWVIGKLEPGSCKFFYVEKIRVGNKAYK
jgi:hypothetical protein